MAILIDSWVTVTRGRWKGRTGLVRDTVVQSYGRAPPTLKCIHRLQFGTDGPFKWLPEDMMREAYKHEIPQGVGPDG